MKIGFLSLKDMRENFWSGTPQEMVAAMRRNGGHVSLMGAVDRGALFWPRVKHHFYRKIHRRTHLQGRDETSLRLFGSRIASELAAAPEIDCLVTPFTATIAYLKTTKPVALWHDATFNSLLDYYPGYERTTLCAETIRSGNNAERAAIRRADLLVYTSDWAAQTAVDFYAADPRKVKVIPYGANLPEVPSAGQIQDVIRRRDFSPTRFLLIGGDWKRKGGDIAFEIVKQLNANGVPAELHVVGADPEGAASESRDVHAYGRLNKDVAGEFEILRGVFQSATFLILPSLAECMGIVSCEANAYGVPVLASRTGGIPTVVREGVNGMLFNLPEMVEGVCRYTRKLIADRTRYVELCERAYREYRDRLNWDSSASRFLTLLNDLVEERPKTNACLPSKSGALASC